MGFFVLEYKKEKKNRMNATEKTTSQVIVACESENVT